MVFDPDTLFLAAGISAAALAMTLLGVWTQNRMDRFLIGWMLGMALLGIGVIVYASFPHDTRPVVALAFTLEIVGFVAIYIAARMFTGSRIRWLAMLGLSIAVVLPVSAPIVLGMDGIGIAIYNILAALLLALCARQYWKGRDEAPLAIAGITVLYALTAVSFLACGAQLFYDGEWVLTARPDNLAERLNAVIAIAGITGIGALSLGLNQSRAARRHRIEARTDSLTGLLNRRAVFDALATEKLRPGDAVIIFDLDRFKLINDQFGHKTGDKVLCHFALILGQIARPGDLAARLGGEEFVLVMRQAPAALATSTAEQIRKSFRSLRLQVDAHMVGSTASAGIAFATHFEADFETVLHSADTALYRAKNNGRDRVFTELQVVA
jgi:diguanylate cyclase (GGDEF)-like protein